jgi:molybdate/tungstate transport system substrate-binding protein
VARCTKGLRSGRRASPSTNPRRQRQPVITEPGFLLGPTDPKTDPKGALTATALKDAAETYDDPKLAAIATSTSNVFPEETLVGRLQAGQLDAGFFYTSQTTPAGQG